MVTLYTRMNLVISLLSFFFFLPSSLDSTPEFVFVLLIHVYIYVHVYDLCRSSNWDASKLKLLLGDASSEMWE